MKLCIVTLYNSVNSGSYWQARILGFVLSNMGHEVYYLERKGGSSSWKYRVKSLLRTITKGNLNSFIIRSNEFKEFKNIRKNFKIIKNKTNELKNIDCFILGSDTIWNLDDIFLNKNYKIYFGGIFENQKVISYGASVGNTSLETLKKYPDIPNMLENMKHISVRDEDTFNIIKNLCNKKIDIVCDPTLLITKNEYLSFIEKDNNEKKYIYLYLFKELSESQSNELKKFASENNLMIISGKNNNYSCCDKCIINSPQNFLFYMNNAEYIVTDTFHGVVFSTNLEKNYVVINRNKKKVNGFLASVNLIDRLITSNEKFSDLFANKINYDEVNKKLNNIRQKSLEYLKNSLKWSKN